MHLIYFNVNIAITGIFVFLRRCQLLEWRELLLKIDFSTVNVILLETLKHFGSKILRTRYKMASSGKFNLVANSTNL